MWVVHTLMMGRRRLHIRLCVRLWVHLLLVWGGSHGLRTDSEMMLWLRDRHWRLLHWCSHLEMRRHVGMVLAGRWRWPLCHVMALHSACRHIMAYVARCRHHGSSTSSVGQMFRRVRSGLRGRGRFWRRRLLWQQRSAHSTTSTPGMEFTLRQYSRWLLLDADVRHRRWVAH